MSKIGLTSFPAGRSLAATSKNDFLSTETAWRTLMSLIATDQELSVMISDLSEALRVFSNEAVKLKALLARSEDSVSPESKYELRKQTIAEIQAFEEYLNRKEEILAYLKVESRLA
jgi:hypothetical protein